MAGVIASTGRACSRPVALGSRHEPRATTWSDEEFTSGSLTTWMWRCRDLEKEDLGALDVLRIGSIEARTHVFLSLNMVNRSLPPHV